MCGIAGIIHRDASSDIGTEMSRMLQSMKHRGPDSSGYALFGPATEGEIVIRFKLADANDPRGFDFSDRLERKPDGGRVPPAQDRSFDRAGGGGDRVRLSGAGALRGRPQGPGRLPGEHPGLRGAFARSFPGDREGPR